MNYETTVLTSARQSVSTSNANSPTASANVFTTLKNTNQSFAQMLRVTVITKSGAHLPTATKTLKHP